jgi:hypothetical protein
MESWLYVLVEKTARLAMGAAELKTRRRVRAAMRENFIVAVPMEDTVKMRDTDPRSE